MGITAVTIDFWNTLYDPTGGEPRDRQRREHLFDLITSESGECTRDEFEQAFDSIWDFFDRHWLESQRTPTSREMIDEILRNLGHRLSDNSVDACVRVFEEGVLEHPPKLLEGAEQALDWLAGRHSLALISDTAFSPGSVLSRLMERDDILRYFDALIYSDETGVAKPHSRAFDAALSALGATPDAACHIGDIERTDIRGAKSHGMTAVLFRGGPDVKSHRYAEPESEADFILESWHAITELPPFRESQP